MDEHIITGIDVGTTKVCALIAEMTADEHYQILGIGVEPAHGMRKGVVVNVDEASAAIQAAIHKAERSAGLEIDTAFVSMAGSHISSVNSHGVAGISQNQWGIDQDDIDRALDAAQAIAIPHGREVLHIIPRGFTVDGQEGVRSPLGMHGFRLEVEAHIVTASSTSIQNLVKCVESSGVVVEAFVLNPLASAEVSLSETEREMGVVVCDIGGGTTDLAIYIDGNVWHTMVLAVGGNHITNDIAHGLRLPAETAEAIKLEHGHANSRNVEASDFFTIHPFGAEKPQQVSRKDLAMIIEARVEEIFSLVLQEIKRSGYDGLLPAGIVITGGVARLPGIRQIANQVLNVPARVATPKDIRGLADQLTGRPEYATSIGLLNWAAHETLAINRSTRRRSGSSRRGPGLSGFGNFLKRLLPSDSD